MARLTLKVDCSDVTAMIKVICAAADGWPQARRDAFHREFKRLLAADDVVKVTLEDGVAAADVSRSFLGLLKHYGIGEVMA